MRRSRPRTWFVRSTPRPRTWTAAEAAACFESGDHLWLPPGHASVEILSALAARRDELREVVGAQGRVDRLGVGTQGDRGGTHAGKA